MYLCRKVCTMYVGLCSMHECMKICVSVCMYVCMHTCTGVCLHACLFECLCVCMYCIVFEHLCSASHNIEPYRGAVSTIGSKKTFVGFVGPILCFTAVGRTDE